MENEDFGQKIWKKRKKNLTLQAENVFIMSNSSPTAPSKHESAMLFVQSLSVRGGLPVPADERGIEALINEKSHHP